MRLEWRCAIVTVALGIGAFGAESYARTATPYYAMMARWIAAGSNWQVVDLDIAPNRTGPGLVLRLIGLVRKQPGDAHPAARIISKLQVAAVVESPLIFWSLLLLWPVKSFRQRASMLCLGIPIFLGLEAVTTVCQLLNPLSFGSAVLAGDPDPVTVWEHWSRFLEAGGRVALCVGAALLAVAIVEVAYARREGGQGKRATA